MTNVKLVVSPSRVHLHLLLAVVLVAPCLSFFLNDPVTPTTPIRIASFNIKHFGRSVVEKTEDVANLKKIFQRYDVVLVMEVRDKTNTALNDLKTSLNSDGGGSWTYVASARIGRTHYKEQYAFFYKNTVTLVSTHQVDDSANDTYEREPFAVEFKYSSASDVTVQREVVLLGFHSKPAKTKIELQELPTTIKSVAALFPNALGVIALGDMNADCRYLSGKWRHSIELFNGADFKSLIPDSADSAVSRMNCAYDRIVVYGSSIDARNGAVFNFQTALGLSQDDAEEVSDHFPVEFSLY